MSRGVTVPGVVLLAAIGCAIVPAHAQPPIRIGATVAQTGVFAEIGQGLLRGYQLCVKHMNERGGVLGRPLELVVRDDRSDPATAVRIYEQLITQDKVVLVFAPFGPPIVDAVADVTEKHKMPMVTTSGATSVYRKGRKFIFGLIPPSELFLEGFLDLAARKGLKTVALISADDLGGRAMRQGGIEVAKKKGLRVVLAETYPQGTTDFATILTKIRTANPDVLGVATSAFDDGVAITRRMKALNVNPTMVGMGPSQSPPKLYEILGRDAEFIYAAAPWLAEVVEVRAGGLIPIAREYPGAREFVEASSKEFPGEGVSPLAYGTCQVLVEAIRGSSSLDSTKVRDAILKMDYHTVVGRFRVDRDGVQTGQKMLLFQWQDGKRAIVWPEELAPNPPRFPTPPWSQRQ